MIPLLKISPLRLRRLMIFSAVGGLLLMIYYLFDPATDAAPKCLFRLITGFECPGCGSQRLLHALTHGDIRAAAEANLLLLTILPYLALWLWVELDPSLTPRLHKTMNSTPAIIAILVILIAWTIIRNIL